MLFTSLLRGGAKTKRDPLNLAVIGRQKTFTGSGTRSYFKMCLTK